MRRVIDPGDDRHHQGADLPPDRNSSLQYLTNQRRPVFRNKGNRHRTLRWALAILFIFGMGYIVTVQPWSTQTPHPKIVQTARARISPEHLQNEAAMVVAAPVAVPSKKLLPGPQYSTAQHDRMYTQIFSTLAEVDSIVRQEGER